MISLTGCAQTGSKNADSTRPPMLEYSQADQTRMADEVLALPEGALIPGWIADYAVLREQARACSVF